MRQFRDNYSGAIIIRRSESDREAERTRDETRELLEALKAERKKIEALRERGDVNADKSGEG